MRHGPAAAALNPCAGERLWARLVLLITESAARAPLQAFLRMIGYKR